MNTTIPPTFEQAARAAIADLAPVWPIHQQAHADIDAAWAALHDPAQPWNQHHLRLLDAHDRLGPAAVTLDVCAERLSRLIHTSHEHETWERRFDSVTAWLAEAGCEGYSWTDGTYQGQATTIIASQQERLAQVHTVCSR